MLFSTYLKFSKEVISYTENHTVGCFNQSHVLSLWDGMCSNLIIFLFDVQLKNHKINQSPIKPFIAIKTQAGWIELLHSLFSDMTMGNIIGIRLHSHKKISFQTKPQHLEIAYVHKQL